MRTPSRPVRLFNIDTAAVRAAFDEQIRRHPVPEGSAGSIECDDRVIRSLSASGSGWAGVMWSDLDEACADAVIATQIARFAELHQPWEWKHYSYDEPADLPDRLIAAGFEPEPAEALLVAEIAELGLAQPPPEGVELQRVLDRESVQALITVHEAAFGGDHSGVGADLLAALASEPHRIEGVLALADGNPIAAGRVEFHEGTDFASLWGGASLPAWRGRGVFGSLVAHRAGLASARGFRYLQVDAMPASRPILRRLGFVELATTTPFTHPPGWPRSGVVVCRADS